MTVRKNFNLINFNSFPTSSKHLFWAVTVLLCLIMKDISATESITEELFQDYKIRSKNNGTKLICFYVFTNDFHPAIMGDLCTHINVGFFRINTKNNSVQPNREQEQALNKIVSLKQKSKHLKIIISVGGADDETFSTMIINHKTRKRFIKSIMVLLKQFKVDGVDLDWEWPVIVDGNEKERVKFIQLLHEIRLEFDRHKKHFILSVDVSSTRAISQLSYIVRYIAQYVDYVNVMCYDYYYFTKWFPFTGHNAPLYGAPKPPFLKSNVNSSIYYWISNLMPRDKIVVGLPTFGHTFKLLFPDKHSILAPATGFGSIGQSGFASYQEVCEFLKKNGTTMVYDNISKVPYAYQYPEWLSFDNEHSLAMKATYILEENLGGAMVFSVNADDFNGSCSTSGLPLPLIRTVRSILFNEV